MVIEKCSWPCVFDMRDAPSLAISTLEALAVLVALELFSRGTIKCTLVQGRGCPTWTDNHGNGATLHKLMTTKFLALTVFEEMAAFFKRTHMRTVFDWRSQQGQSRGGRSGKRVLDGNNPALRILLKADVPVWSVLHEGLEAGRTAERDYQDAK